MNNMKAIAAANAVDLKDLQAQIKSVERKADKVCKMNGYDKASKLFDKAAELKELKVSVEGYRKECREAERESIWAYRFYYSMTPWEEDNSQRLIEEHDHWAEEYLKDIARLLNIEDDAD